MMWYVVVEIATKAILYKGTSEALAAKALVAGTCIGKHALPAVAQAIARTRATWHGTQEAATAVLPLLFNPPPASKERQDSDGN